MMSTFKCLSISLPLFLTFFYIHFQDLKKYNFYYWFCFPALCFPEGIKIIQPPSALEKVFSAKQVCSPTMSMVITNSIHKISGGNTVCHLCFLCPAIVLTFLTSLIMRWMQLPTATFEYVHLVKCALRCRIV